MSKCLPDVSAGSRGSKVPAASRHRSERLRSDQRVRDTLVSGNQSDLKLARLSGSLSRSRSAQLGT